MCPTRRRDTVYCEADNGLYQLLKRRVGVVSEGGLCDVHFAAVGGRAVGYSRVPREVKYRTWRFGLDLPRLTSQGTRNNKPPKSRHSLDYQKSGKVCLDNANASTTSKSIPTRSANSSHCGDTNMASAGEMDTNATAENLVRDLVLINARGYKLDTNYLVQGHNAPNQDANIAPAVGTSRNNESTHLVSDLVLDCARNAKTTPITSNRNARLQSRKPSKKQLSATTHQSQRREST
jgi:hypothetical protein